MWDQSPDPYCVSQNGRLIDFNGAFADLVGGTREALLGRAPGDFSPERQAGGASSAEIAQVGRRKALEHGHHRFEWILLTLQGEEIPVVATLMAINLGQGEILATIFRDLRETYALRAAEQAARADQEILTKAQAQVADTLASALKRLATGDLVVAPQFEFRSAIEQTGRGRR